MVVVAEPTIPCDRRKKMALRLSGLAMNIRPNATASASFASIAETAVSVV
jgi:hypothetical protein